MDWILSGLAIAAFVAFVAVIARFVPELDLLIVLGAAVLMAVFDFARSLRTQWRIRGDVDAAAAAERDARER